LLAVDEPVWAVPLLAVACVPLAPPAAPCVPSIEPDCVVPVSVEAVFVFLLLLLQARTIAAPSANGNVNFIIEPPCRGVTLQR
jgi:hypothetical protein